MALERCIRQTAQYERFWQVGEVRTVSRTDEQGNPLVSDHFRLVGGEEKISDKDFYDPALVEEKRKESGMRDRRAGITRALEQLDPDDDDHWTRRGEPSIQKVFALTSFEVSRGALREVWPEFDRVLARSIRADRGRAVG